MIRYGIIGAGAIGKAIGNNLKSAKLTVNWWDKDVDLRTTANIRDFIEEADVILFCLPSWSHASVISEIKPYLKQSHVVITVAKGVVSEFISIDKFFDQQLNDINCNYGLLYGPMLASELAENMKSFAVLSLKNESIVQEIMNDLSVANIYTEFNDDMHSVALCAVLKNIYAIGFGIHDGLSLGANTKGALASKVLIELQAILNNLGADSKIALSYAGLGDMLATGWSEASHNHRIGLELAKAFYENKESEGINSLKGIKSIINISEFPIINTLYEIAIEHNSATKINELLK